MDKGTFIYEAIGGYGSVYYCITIDENGVKSSEKLFPKSRQEEKTLRDLALFHQKQFGEKKMKTEVNTEMTYKNANELEKSLRALAEAKRFYKMLTMYCNFTIPEIENRRNKSAGTKDGAISLKPKGNGLVFSVKSFTNSNLENWEETPLNEESLYEYLMKNKDIKLVLDLFDEFYQEECKK